MQLYFTSIINNVTARINLNSQNFFFSFFFTNFLLLYIDPAVYFFFDTLFTLV